MPTVNPIHDNATVIIGKAESNATVYAMIRTSIGYKEIGEAISKNGSYSIKIPKQKA
ncbi:hypothetical protein [Bacillus mangrovi]|uniref:hypothetical protein n=1 Tax=Metabacillus mangrovi TaxID=1491830 RepID=UPI001391A3C8